VDRNPQARVQGVRATAASPNAYLFQSLAVLAADMGRTEEARKWFHKGTNTLMVRIRHRRYGAVLAIAHLMMICVAVTPRGLVTRYCLITGG